MASLINPTLPTPGFTSTLGVRNNFAHAHDEITALQNAIAPNSQLLGGNGTALVPVAVGAGLSLAGGILSATATGGGSGTVGSGTGPQIAQYAAGTGTVVGGATLSGDATIAQGGALTLANSGVAAGTYNNVTVNAKGLATGGSNVTYLTGNQTIAISGDIAGSGATAITTTLPTVNTNVGTWNNVTINAKGLATSGSNVAYLTSSGVSGMTTGQLPIAATATTITSSVAYGTTGNNTIVQTGATGNLAAATMPAYTGDVTSPAGSTVNTLPVVNSNIGTFNNVTINAKGLATAGSNVAYLTAAVTSLTAGTGITLTPATIVGTGSIALTSPVVVANGGTGATTLTIGTNTYGYASGVLRGNGTGAVTTDQWGGWGDNRSLVCYNAGTTVPPYIEMGSAANTNAAPQATPSGATLGQLVFKGFGTAWGQAAGAIFRCVAAELFSATAGGNYFTFTTNTPTTLTNAERVRIGQGLMVNTTTDSGAGNVNVSGGYYVNNVAIPNGTVTSLTAGTGITLTPATITATGTIALTTPVVVANGGTGLSSGTSGGIPYYSTTTAMTSSAALGAGLVVTGGGAGAAPATIANGQLPATATNDNATAGHVGEFVESNIPAASAVNAAASGTAFNVTNISLTAGDWDVWGGIYVVPAGSTTVSNAGVATNTTSATFPDQSHWGEIQVATPGFTGNNAAPVAGFRRYSLAATTTVYLIAFVTYATSTCAVCGTLSARRAR